MTESRNEKGQFVSEKNDRTPRENDSRQDQTFRANDAWQEASRLPKPNPVPGWRFKWVRTSMTGETDVGNVSKAFREGWVAALAEDHPEIQSMSDLDSRWPDSIEVGGLLLCKLPEERAQAREEFYRKKSQAQVDAVDGNYMQDNDSRMKKFSEKESRTSRSRFGGS